MRAAAFEVTRGMSVAERMAELGKLQRHILANKEAIIDRIVAETGKARTEALLSEIYIILDALAYYRKMAPRFLAEAVGGDAAAPGR